MVLHVLDLSSLLATVHEIALHHPSSYQFPRNSFNKGLVKHACSCWGIAGSCNDVATVCSCASQARTRQCMICASNRWQQLLESLPQARIGSPVKAEPLHFLFQAPLAREEGRRSSGRLSAGTSVKAEGEAAKPWPCLAWPVSAMQGMLARAFHRRGG